MPTETTTKITPDEIRTKIVAVAATATPEDRAAVEEIIARAMNAEPSSAVYKLTAPMSALIFLNHNSRNRDWRVERTLEFSRRMQERFWKFNGISIGFYVTGVLDDGQHRVAAAALAGHTLQVPIAFGVQLEAVDTIDGSGGVRHGADHAKLEGIGDAKRKQTVIIDAGRYFSKAGIPADILLSETEITAAMHRNDTELTACIHIGDNSAENIVSPLLKGTQAATLAYVMLKSNWPAANIAEKLALVQLRVSQDGENSPFFIAAKMITDSRDKKARADKLSPLKEIAVCIKAFQEAEAGSRAVQPRMIRDAVSKKKLPDPTYPTAAAQAAE